MFHGRRWRNLSESNNSILVISVNTFLKYFSGFNWLSLAVEDELPSLWANAAIEGDPVLLWLMSERGIGALEIFEWSSEEHSVQKHFSSGIAWFTISTKIFEVSIFRFFWYTILPKPFWNPQSFRFVLLPDQTGLIVCHLPEDGTFFQLFFKKFACQKSNSFIQFSDLLFQLFDTLILFVHLVHLRFLCMNWIIFGNILITIPKIKEGSPNLIMAYWSLWSLICVHNGHLLVETHSPISADTQAYQRLIDISFLI